MNATELVGARAIKHQLSQMRHNSGIDRDETADMFVAKGVDAVIVGNAS